MGHSIKPITRTQKYTTVFEKLDISLKGTMMIKIDKNSNNQGLHHPNFKFLVFATTKN
jgi:hypothetical protein